MIEWVMLALCILGLLLFLGGRPLARWMAPDARDPVGAGRLLQAAGVLVLLCALLLSPREAVGAVHSTTTLRAGR